MQGASEIKLTAGGGVASPFSPLDVSTFTAEELRAAVEAAENWGTYVAVHGYTPAAIQRAIEAGVKCIEHGHLMDEATARLMAERGVWLSTQPFLDDRDATPFPQGSQQRLKQLEVIRGTSMPWQKSTRSRPPSGPTSCSPRHSRSARRATRKIGAMVYARRDPGSGDVRERRTSAALGRPQPLSRQARRRSGRRSSRPAPGGRRPNRQYQTHRRPSQELRCNHEGLQALQDRRGPSFVRSCLTCTRAAEPNRPWRRDCRGAVLRSAAKAAMPR
jgi:hypothetical protein